MENSLHYNQKSMFQWKSLYPNGNVSFLIWQSCPNIKKVYILMKKCPQYNEKFITEKVYTLMKNVYTLMKNVYTQTWKV